MVILFRDMRETFCHSLLSTKTEPESEAAGVRKFATFEDLRPQDRRAQKKGEGLPKLLLARPSHSMIFVLSLQRKGYG